MDIRNVNQHLSEWYESIPGGRLTILGVVISLIVLIVIMVYASHVIPLWLKARRERKERVQRKSVINPLAPHEVVIHKWRD